MVHYVRFDLGVRTQRAEFELPSSLLDSLTPKYPWGNV